MVNKILREAGIQYRRGRYTAKPLPDTYAVYMDERAAGGADGINCLITHNITVELYATKQDEEAREALEAVLDSYGIEWTAQDWYWLQDEQRYQAIYEFTYIEKRRINNG